RRAGTGSRPTPAAKRIFALSGPASVSTSGGARRTSVAGGGPAAHLPACPRLARAPHGATELAPHDASTAPAPAAAPFTRPNNIPFTSRLARRRECPCGSDPWAPA